MLKDTDYVLAHYHETIMDGKPLGVRIFIAAGRNPNEQERRVASHVAEQIFNEVWKTNTLESEAGKTRAYKEKQEILKLFAGKYIFVEEIPNGYCSQPCCVNLPWFIVTTPIGHIKIGWRKRVINIDWSKTIQKKTAAELFPNEDVTKGEQSIHAWSYEKAKEYLDLIHHEVPNV